MTLACPRVGWPSWRRAGTPIDPAPAPPQPFVCGGQSHPLLAARRRCGSPRIWALENDWASLDRARERLVEPVTATGRCDDSVSPEDEARTKAAGAKGAEPTRRRGAARVRLCSAYGADDWAAAHVHARVFYGSKRPDAPALRRFDRALSLALGRWLDARGEGGVGRYRCLVAEDEAADSAADDDGNDEGLGSSGPFTWGLQLGGWLSATPPPSAVSGRSPDGTMLTAAARRAAARGEVSPLSPLVAIPALLRDPGPVPSRPGHGSAAALPAIVGGLSVDTLSAHIPPQRRRDRRTGQPLRLPAPDGRDFTGRHWRLRGAASGEAVPRTSLSSRAFVPLPCPPIGAGASPRDPPVARRSNWAYIRRAHGPTLPPPCRSPPRTSSSSRSDPITHESLSTYPQQSRRPPCPQTSRDSHSAGQSG